MFNPLFRRLKKSGFVPLPIIKGGFIPLTLNVNAGYQPTESVKTSPPDASSGVQPPKSGSNAQKPITYPHNIILTGSPNCKGAVYFPKAEGEKEKHKVYISLETAKRLIEKKKINRLEKKIPLPVEKHCIELSHIDLSGCKLYGWFCPCCGFSIPQYIQQPEYIQTKCRICGQRWDRVDLKEVKKDD